VTVQSDPRFAELDRWIERRLEHDRIPGVSLAITTRDETIFIGGGGFANLESQTPVAPHHAFEIGSIGKSFTALLLLRMHERGEVDLHTPITEYLPWFSVQSEYEPITAHHLLTHTAGIIGGSDMAADGRFEAWHLRDTEVSGPPGSRFNYSNVGYKTLGYLIENLTGKSYGQAVTEEILAPLGMIDSFSPITNRERLRVATPYRRLYDDRPHRWTDPLVPDTWIETGTADGGIACTPGDFAIYARALMNRATSLVADASFANLIADFSGGDTVDRSATYGYGFATFEHDGRRIWGHAGGMVGHYALLAIDPEAGIAACGAVNGPGAPSSYVYAALDFARALLAGHPPVLPEIAAHTEIEDAEQYAGEYANDNITCRLTAEGRQLYLEWEEERTLLEQREPGRFFADHPALDRDLLVAERDGETVIAIHHGPYWLGKTGLVHASPEPAPAEWTAYTGWYRCHNPWLGLIRIIERRGRLLIAHPNGDESELFALGDGRFRIGEAPAPERIAFDAVADGVALRADMNGQAYYRTPESSVESGTFEPVR
jgi:CubicO group peptidase (beta-lactamase class C family)